MNETTWADQIRDILNEEFKKSNPALHADVEVKLPYGIMIKEFKIEEEAKKGTETKELWKPVYAEGSENKFATDLLIYEDAGNGNRIPRVVIEAKINDASTHDVITYGKKAVMHRALMPALRYGMMLGASKDDALTWKHFTHGSDFDFMFAFKGEVPDEKEQEKFCALVDSEIAISKKLEAMLETAGAKLDIYCVQKKLEIEPNK